MRYLVFALVILTVLCQSEKRYYYRYRNGNVTVDGQRYEGVEGTIFRRVINSDLMMSMIFGITKGSMKPFVIDGIHESSKQISWYACDQGNIFGVYWQLSGDFKVFADNWDAGVSNYCTYGDYGKIEFEIKGASTTHFPYLAKDAGLRAKNLTGKSIEYFKPHEVIGYAIYDHPYELFDNCADFQHERFPEVLGPTPGAIMLGRDGKHCAIMDNEGAKFTHSNPIKKVVTTDSIVMSHIYFPEGVVYKGYPKDWPY